MPLDVAPCCLTCHLAAARMAGRSRTWPRACSRWLPDWLPEISLATLMFERHGPPEAHASPARPGWTAQLGGHHTQPDLPKGMDARQGGTRLVDPQSSRDL
jgi:hypothetical protein